MLVDLGPAASLLHHNRTLVDGTSARSGRIVERKLLRDLSVICLRVGI